MKNEFILKSDKDTKDAGEKIGRLISSKMCIYLCGDLGTGKTSFAQGLAKGLGISEEYYITSPTYSIINEYPGPVNFYHIDLYRIEDIIELDYIGLNEIIDQENSVVAIEWPEILIKDPSCSYDLKINFSIHEEFQRKISVFSSGRKGSNLLKNLLL